MTVDADVVVVGRGIAGCAAAMAARERGAGVVVVEAGASATALAGGAWDVTGDGRWATDEVRRTRPTLSERVELLRHRIAAHPYARIAGETIATIRHAHDRVLSALGNYRPLDFQRSGVLVVTDLGLLRRADTAQRHVLDMEELRGKRITVASLPGSELDGRFVAESLSEIADERDPDGRFEHVTLEGPDRGPFRYDWQLAATCDRDASCLELARALADAIAGRDVDAVLLPPCLGLDDDRVPERISEEIGLPVGEVVAPLTSSQGLRLDRWIREALHGAGCVLRRAPVRRVLPEAAGTRVELQNGTTLRAGATVLATGKHVGGGLVVEDGMLREPLGGLPIWSNGRLAPLPSSPDGPDPRRRFGGNLFAGGPGYQQGVGYDERLLALGSNGAPAAEDLFVAGALLEGVEPARDGSGLGCCATTGFVAGRGAAERAGT